MTPTFTRRLTRAEKVQANTEALRDSAYAILLESGFDSLTFQGLAKGADLTVGAVYSRFDTPSDVVIDLWHSRLIEWFRQWIGEVITTGDDGDARTISEVLKRGQRDGGMGLVCLEVLLSSLFDEELQEVVAAEVAVMIEPMLKLDKSRPELTPHAAAAHALLLSFAFGRLIAAREVSRPAALKPEQCRALAAHAQGKQADTKARQRVAVGWRRVLDAREVHASVIEAAMDLVARVGYRRSTITRIARRAGVSRGGLLAG